MPLPAPALYCFIALIVIGSILVSDVESETRPQGGIKIGLLWWPSEGSMRDYWTGREVEECVANILREEEPQLSIIPQQVIRDLLFPLMEPRTQPRTEAEFGSLLARSDVHERLSKGNLNYLLAFSGSTKTSDGKGGVLCGAGYGGGGCFGFYWEGKNTRLDGALWSIEGNPSVDNSKPEKLHGAAAGETLIPAFILPVPIIAPTEYVACRELANHTLRIIRKGP